MRMGDAASPRDVKRLAARALSSRFQYVTSGDKGPSVASRRSP